MPPRARVGRSARAVAAGSGAHYHACVALMAGAVLDRRYALVRRLGAGGFGAVWLAMDVRTGRDVAVKVLRVSVSRAEHSGVQQRFLDEAIILSRLDHPSIVRALDRFVDGEHSCIVTDFVAGPTLRAFTLSRLQSGRELRLDEFDALIEPISQALAHAHARGVVHRDLKPQNVMLTDAVAPLGVRVLDFGVARLMQSDEADATTVGRLVGTLIYMAPEQFETPKIGPAADQFALASMVFELLTLRWAWAREEAEPSTPKPIATHLPGSSVNGYGTLLYRICHGPRPSVVALRPDLPADIDTVLHRAWQRDPAKRFPSMFEFAAAVRAAILPQLNERTAAEATQSILESLPEATLTMTVEGNDGVPPSVAVNSSVAHPPTGVDGRSPARATPDSMNASRAAVTSAPGEVSGGHSIDWLGPLAGLGAAIVTVLGGMWFYGPPDDDPMPTKGSPAAVEAPAVMVAPASGPVASTTTSVAPRSDNTTNAESAVRGATQGGATGRAAPVRPPRSIRAGVASAPDTSAPAGASPSPTAAPEVDIRAIRRELTLASLDPAEKAKLLVRCERLVASRTCPDFRRAARAVRSDAASLENVVTLLDVVEMCLAETHAR